MGIEFIPKVLVALAAPVTLLLLSGIRKGVIVDFNRN